MAFTLTAGIIGYHISATLAKSLLSLPRLYPELNCQIRLKSLCGRNREAVRAAAQAFGFEHSTDRWQELVEDPDIDLLVNGGPNFLHAQPCLEALEMNKHVFCEKPLARSVAEAKTMAGTADRVSGTAMVGYNYRFVPAVILARRLIQEGRIGRLYHGCFRYIDEAFIDAATPFSWRMDRERSGRGVLGDLGSHAVDLVRFLVGEPEAVSGFTRIFVGQREDRQVVSAPDAAFGTLHFGGDFVVTFETSSFAAGKKNQLFFELFGESGSLAWNLERMNELRVYLNQDKHSGVPGFRTVYVSRLDHPDLVPWPVGEHPVGIDISYLLEFRHLVNCIRTGIGTAPDGADFSDGLSVEVVCEGIEESSRKDGQLIPLVS